jgi:hypothetical protein
MSNTNDFLDANYEVPKGPSNYAKFEQGDNKFRILSKPSVGWQYFGHDNKPVRHEGAPQPMVDKSLIKADKYGKQDLRHIWVMLVWNYQLKQIQVLEITQTSIQGRIKELSQSADWGSPFTYDIIVTKKGTGKETEYSVTPVPPKPITDEVKAAYIAKPCNIKAMFNGGDPFAKTADIVVEVPKPKPVEQPASLVQDASDLPF